MEAPDDFKHFKPGTPEELVAAEVARALNDPEHLRVYLAFAKRYTPSQMLRVCALVKEVPNELIKKSRGAFFSWLIQRYETPKQQEDPRH